MCVLVYLFLTVLFDRYHCGERICVSVGVHYHWYFSSSLPLLSLSFFRTLSLPSMPPPLSLTLFLSISLPLSLPPPLLSLPSYLPLPTPFLSGCTAGATSFGCMWLFRRVMGLDDVLDVSSLQGEWTCGKLCVCVCVCERE